VVRPVGAVPVRDAGREVRLLTMSAQPATVDELAAAFERELTTNKRAAAETAYALALRYRNEDVGGRRRFDLAKEWAARSVKLLDKLPSETVDQVASTRQYVGGVPIPELLHTRGGARAVGGHSGLRKR
jgi:hypothetical protein